MATPVNLPNLHFSIVAKFSGNIFNRAAGSIGGQTFSQARYRGGKLQTGRQKTSPSNPDADPQKATRNRFRLISEQMKFLNKNFLNPAFRGTVQNLAPFQALQSILLNVTAPGVHGATILSAPPDTFHNSGHVPNSFSTSYSGKTITFTWSTENGQNGKSNDPVFYLYFYSQPATGKPQPLWATIDLGPGRNVGSKTFTVPESPNDTGGFLGAIFCVDADAMPSIIPSTIKWDFKEI